MAGDGSENGDATIPLDSFEPLKKNGTLEHHSVFLTIDPSARSFDPRVTCSICQAPYYSPREDGTTEDVVLMHCGHYLGKQCAEQWLHASPSCPFCRCQLRFGCGHTIAPVKAFAGPPPKANENNRCGKCYVAGLDDIISYKVMPLELQVSSDQEAVRKMRAKLEEELLGEHEMEEAVRNLIKAEEKMRSARARLRTRQEATAQLRKTLVENLALTWHMAL